MLTNISEPHPDQTIQSYVTGLQIQNATPKWQSLMKYLFNGYSINPRSIIQRGLSHFLQTEAGVAFGSFEQLIQDHSLLALYRPFVDDGTWEKIINKLKSNIISGTGNILGFVYDNPFRTIDWYCPACVKEDINQFGYAYAHRSHQLKGNYFCAKHQKLIGPLTRGNTEINQHNGLLIPRTDNCSVFSIQDHDYPELSSSAHIQFSQWVEACFSNHVENTDFNCRIQVINDQLLKYSGKSNNAGASALNKLLIKKYGDSFLKSINQPLTISDSQWPFLYLHGYAYHSHPVTNILILNVLFKDTTELTSILNSTKSYSIIHKKNCNHKVTPNISWTYGIIKDILREKSLKNIVKKHPIGLPSLTDLLRLIPTLQERRKRSLRNILRRKHRRIVLQYLAQNPDSSRRSLFTEIRSTYNWIIKNDARWFNENLPTRKSTTAKRSYPNISPDDALLADKITEIHAQLTQRKQTKLITMALLIKKIESVSGKKVYDYSHPETFKMIREHYENQVAFKKRLLEDIAYYARLNDIDTCISLTTKLLKRIEFGQNIINDILKTVIDNIPRNSTFPNNQTYLQTIHFARTLEKVHNDSAEVT